MKPSWQSTVLGVAFLAFFVAILWLGLTHASNFSTVWAALGSIVGVITGAIPSYFFKQQVQSTQADLNKAHAINTVYAEALPNGAVNDVHQELRARNLIAQ